MIYTVTLNPALDYVVQVDELKVGMINRAEREWIFPGGKGINVSSVLKELGHESVALGFVAGFTGNQLIRELQQRNIQSDFISLERGATRINMKVKGKNETEINGTGPEIPPVAVKVLMIQMERLKPGDVLVLSGSVPKTLPQDIYENMMLRLLDRKVKIVVDTTGESLLKTLQYRPFLIKPNKDELEELFGSPIETLSDFQKHALKLQNMGAENVLISMADQGAFLLDAHGDFHISKAPRGVVKNSVGAGDSMVAGFLASYIENGDYEKAFYMGISAGSASAFSEYLASRSEILEVFHKNFS